MKAFTHRLAQPRVPFPTPKRLGAGLSFVLFASWLLTFFLTNPLVAGDYGGFVTVAERLVSGDKLYVDVWDNKEPVFFYLLALGRLISPLSGWFIEFLWFAVCSAAAYAIAVRLGCSVRRATLTAGVGVPLILAGAPYWAGSSHTPGIALALVSIALFQAGKTSLSGLFLGILPFIKILAFPTTALAVGVLTLYAFSIQRVARLVLGVLAGATSVIVLLVLRGEWQGFLRQLTYNSAYASDVVDEPTLTQSAIGHLANVFTTQVIVSTAVAISLLGSILLFSILEMKRSPQITSFAWSGVAAFVGAVLTIAATGLWYHHALLLSIPFTLALLAFSASLPVRDGFAAFFVIALAAYALSGFPEPQRVVQKMEYARANIWLQIEPPDIGLDQLSVSERTFARVGGGNLTGVGRALRDWKLACPYFAQYPWDSREQLEEMLDCLNSVNVVYISRKEFNPTPSPSAFNEFRVSVDLLLDADFDCSEVTDGELCIRRSVA